MSPTTSSSRGPSRVASLQPSITVTLQDLGMLDRLVACTKYCADVVPEVRDREIQIISDSWSAKAGEILAAKPDLVIASVPYRMEAVAEIMKAGVPFLGLAPKTLADVYSDIQLIAGVMNNCQQGEKVVREMQDRVAEIAVLYEGSHRPKVFVEEWGKPIIHSQGWVAELVETAGGSFVGTPGAKTDSETVLNSDPDVMVAAWCGAGDRVPLEKIVRERGWNEMKAVRDGRVFCISDELLNTPGPTLVKGLAALYWALHPETEKPAGIRQMINAV